MNIEIITKTDLSKFKEEIVNEIKTLLDNKNQEHIWLKTSEARKLLGCSEGTLINLRNSGALPYSKVKGTIYVKKSDLYRLFESGFNA